MIYSLAWREYIILSYCDNIKCDNIIAIVKCGKILYIHK